MKPARGLAVALAVAAIVASTGYVADAALGGNAGATEVRGPGLVTVDVGIRHSRFAVDALRVAEGTLVRFVVDNGDPIAHELVVGSDDVHARHATGHERVHPPIPGEVSVDPGEIGVTMYEFDEPGTVVFACHLPRHLEYGMSGTIEVLAAS